MAEQTKERWFGGVKFTTTTLKASIGFPLAVKIGKVFAPVLLDPKFSMAGGAEQFATIFYTLDSDEAMPLARELFQKTEAVVDGRRWELSSDRAFDKVFTGELPLLFTVMGFVAEANFGNFFADGLASDPADNPPEESSSSSTTTSPSAGPSTDSG